MKTPACQDLFLSGDTCLFAAFLHLDGCALIGPDHPRMRELSPFTLTHNTWEFAAVRLHVRTLNA